MSLEPTSIPASSSGSTSTAYSLTVKQLLTGATDRFAKNVALVHSGRSFTYGELAQQANQLARRLQSFGVGAGDPVAMLLPNGPEYVISDQAIARAGAARVALTEMLSAPEIAYCLEDCGAEVAIAHISMLDAALGADVERLRIVIVVGGKAPSAPEVGPTFITWDEALAGQSDTVPDSSNGPHDLGLVIYTGGTTGRSKGVLHTQGGLAVNLHSHLVETGFDEDDRLLLMSPLPHASGFLLQAAMLRGATVYLEHKFDPELVLSRVAQDGVTYTFMVPTMIYRVIDSAAGRDLDLSSLRTILYGAAPITVERLRQGLDVFGSVFMQLYGQSEAPNFLTRLTRADHSTDPKVAHRLTSCGRQVAMSIVRVVDDETGEDVPTGDVGEVIAATPYNMIGYLGRPEATEKTLRDGWLYTGDIGRLDEDGYLYLLDRKNDMIISGGMNVYTSEVEAAIADAELVNDVAVVGVPHPDWGEAVVAYVVKNDGESLDGADLEARVIAACKEAIAKYKVPKRVFVVEELPTTVFGKIDKKSLRQLPAFPDEPSH